MSASASKITSPTIVYPTVYPSADQSKHQSSAPLALARGTRRGPVNYPRKWPVARKMFPFDDVIMSIFEIPPDLVQKFQHISMGMPMMEEKLTVFEYLFVFIQQ